MSQQNVNATADAGLNGETHGHAGMPNLNDDSMGTAKRAVAFFVVAVILVLGLSLAVWMWMKSGKRDTADQAQMQTNTSVPSHVFDEAKLAPVASTAPPPVPAVQPVVAPLNVAAAAPLPPPTVDKSASGLMAGGQDTVGAAEPAAAPAAASSATLAALNQRTAGGDQGGMAQLLTGTQTASRKAGTLKDRSYLLAKGAFINCALQTKLDSTVPGMTSCVVVRNVYSDDGKVLLIERGSTVTGEYQSNMSQGMKRIFVLWDRVKTPSGVIVDLGSPGADALGGSGLPGYVDTHFWERFGGAIVISVIGDTVSGLANAAQNGSNNNNITFGNTQGTGQQMAAEALRNSINIPPTLYKNQGEEIGIFVARDLDFSSVYELHSN